MRFDLRRVVVTSKARDALPTGSLRLEDLRELHQSGDRGDVSDETAQLNEQAVQKQFAPISTHAAPAGERIT